MSDSQTPDAGTIPVETLRPVVAGWTIDELRQCAGEPFQIQDAASTVGPTEFWRSVGFSIFDFDVDRDLDEVWVYRHDRRGKFELKVMLYSFVGIRAGHVTGIWQHQAP